MISFVKSSELKRASCKVYYSSLFMKFSVLFFMINVGLYRRRQYHDDTFRLSGAGSSLSSANGPHTIFIAIRGTHCKEVIFSSEKCAIACMPLKTNDVFLSRHLFCRKDV